MFDFLDKNNIGKDYKDFLLISIDDIPDYKAKGIYLRHKKTGLEIYHILKDDKENLFAFCFRTISKDNLGTAHIMEHSTLCGSEKYPLKEPFTTLSSTSLNTFLNALTYPDKTVYPGSSVVHDDYFNMLDVYADAVFFPKLDYATFIQEGHRLEMDENGKLSIQGVVYNEMKGNYSSFHHVVFDEQINAMFPNSYPSFESGGDPLEIPNLTYEQFLNFHQKFYNPDNCLLFLYGDIPTAEQLDFFDERFISRIENKYNCKNEIKNYDSKRPLIKDEIQELKKLNLLEKSSYKKVIAPDSGATGNFVSMNWYTGKVDMEKYYLSEVLFGNDSSPFSLALKTSNLGDDVNCGNFGQFAEEFFSIGLFGVKKDDEQKVYDLIEKTIHKIYEDGICQEDIDSAIMGIDFYLREVNRYFGPPSIQIMEKVLKSWMNGNACNSNLTPISSFEKIKQKIKADKNFTKNLIKKYFIDNKVIVKFVAEPSSKFFEERNKSESELIKNLEKNLDKNQLKKDLDELHQYQQHIETPEETSCIPTTKLSSLNSKIERPVTNLQFIKGFDGSEIPLFISKEETNGIFYLDVLFPFDRLEPKYFQYIPFLSNVITNLGWNNKSWDECISESACVMGDVWGKFTTGKLSDVKEVQDYISKYKDYNFYGRQWLGISCKALTSMAEKTLSLLAEIITTMSFSDENRFGTLIQELISEKKAILVDSGLDYASKRAKCLLGPLQALSEILNGISQLYTVENYAKNSLRESLNIFEYIYKECLKSGGIVHITADEDSLNKILPLLEKFVQNAKITKLLPAKKITLEELKPYISQNDAIENKNIQIINYDSQTGYAFVSSPASEYLSKESASEIILASWLKSHTLWDKIRTTGGAYGSGVEADSLEKTLSFWSYRDPNPEKSLEVYLESLKEICENDFPKEDIEKTIVSCYGDVIVPVSPKDRGARSFTSMIYGISPDFKQINLNNLFEVTPQDVKNAAKRLYDLSQKQNQKAIFCNKSDKSIGNNIKIPL